MLYHHNNNISYYNTILFSSRKKKRSIHYMFVHQQSYYYFSSYYKDYIIMTCSTYKPLKLSRYTYFYQIIVMRQTAIIYLCILSEFKLKFANLHFVRRWKKS